jgi:hypothetical protein
LIPWSVVNNRRHREERDDYETNEDGFQKAAGADYRRSEMKKRTPCSIRQTPGCFHSFSRRLRTSGPQVARNIPIIESMLRQNGGDEQTAIRRSSTNNSPSTSRTGNLPPVRSKPEIDSVPDKTQLHGTIAGQHQTQCSFGRGHKSASSLPSTSPDVYSLFFQPMSDSIRTSSPRSFQRP